MLFWHWTYELISNSFKSWSQLEQGCVFFVAVSYRLHGFLFVDMKACHRLTPMTSLGPLHRHVFFLWAVTADVSSTELRLSVPSSVCGERLRGPSAAEGMNASATVFEGLTYTPFDNPPPNKVSTLPLRVLRLLYAVFSLFTCWMCKWTLLISAVACAFEHKDHILHL